MNVLLILGHPRKDSFCGALFEAYRDGALRAGVELRTLVLADLAFDTDVHTESPEQQHYEPDIRHARELVDWADHLVFVYPTWWGASPALLKGFLDRIITPGFAFHFRDPDKLGWDKLWKGKTSQTITTMDTPPVLHRWLYRQPGTNALRRASLGFCGVRSRRALMFGPMRLSTDRQRQAWLERVRRAGLAVRGGTLRKLGRQVTPWLMALRLQFYPMSWAAYTIGALAIAGADVFRTAVYWWGYLCLFALEAATVFANEYFDYESDRNNCAAGPFNGGSRMLVEHKLDFRNLRHGIAVALTAAVVCAAFAIELASAPGTVTVLLAVVFVLTLGYTTPPLKWCYRGLGELDVAVSHSFMVLLVGYLLQGGLWWTATPWLLALPICVSILPAIILSALPDHHADIQAGKGTLPVRLGARAATWLALALTIAAAALGLIMARMAPTHVAYHDIVWGMVPHAGLLVLMLLRLLHGRERLADRRIDAVMVVALSYILWFVAIPFWNLV
ncbi:MAG TPA: NAD(P)H-dependent oxidoreductase [Oleiagrimonas sp.]|nr:NAD(P)H-dependent oxidoreductase [Oleiagrimonas sp.]